MFSLPGNPSSLQTRYISSSKYQQSGISSPNYTNPPPNSPREHNFRNQTATTSSPCIVPSQTLHQPPHRNGSCRRRLGLSPPRYSRLYVPYARRPPQPPQYHHTTCCSLAPWLIEFPRWKLTLDRQSPFAGCLKPRLIPTPLDLHPMYLTPLPRPASASKQPQSTFTQHIQSIMVYISR